MNPDLIKKTLAMPKQRQSQEKSSQGNKSDMQENDGRGDQQQQDEVKQSPENGQIQAQKNQIINNLQLQSKQPEGEKHEQSKDNQQQSQACNRYVLLLIKETLYRQSYNFNWNLKDFDLDKAVQEFGKLDRHKQLQDSGDELQISNLQEESKKQDNQIKLKVCLSDKQTAGLGKRAAYVIRGNDKNGVFEIQRTYKQFVLLRQKLVLGWPGCFIPPVPTKKFGNNPQELMLIRMKFLNSFLKKLGQMRQIYYGEQCSIFFNHSTQEHTSPTGKVIQLQLQKLKAHSNMQLLSKYKQAFKDSVQELTEQEQLITIGEIKELQSQLRSWRVDLSNSKDQIRSLISAKDKYYQAMTRLSTVLLPEYEDLVVGWIDGGELSRKQQGKQSPGCKQGYLLNTQQYGAALKDTVLSVKTCTQPLWLIYDIFRFQLKETDSILQAIASYQFLAREKHYLSRNIVINKEQIQSLDEKKTTLKIFIMSGSTQEKKQRLNKQSEGFQQKLNVVKQLLNFVLNLLIDSIDNFHSHRADQYRKLLGRSSQEQLVLVKKLMDFHLFQLQLFKGKDICAENSISQKQQVDIAQQTK